MSPQQSTPSEKLAKLLLARLSDDGMEGYVMIRAGEEFKASVGEIAETLRTKDIKEGLIPEAVQQLASLLAEARTDAVELLAARGRPPVDGRDGNVIYEFETKLAVGKVESDGSIDYRERGLVHNVQTGQTLATVIPATEGTEGISVTGRRIPAKRGNEPVRPQLGHNVKISEDRLTYCSTIEGHATLSRAGTLQVSPELRIAGDVDFAVGNIDFTGNVTIAGAVRSGFTVKAGGDITVAGEVESKAQLSAGRNVVVRGAIRTGTDEPRVHAGADIEAVSFENAVVRAGGDIRAEKLVLDSHLECHGTFICERGEVRGGDIQAVGGIVLNSAGTPDGAPCTLVAGLTRRVAARIQALEGKIAELNQTAEAVFGAFRSRYEEVLKDREALKKMPREEREQFEKEKKAASQRQETLTGEIQKHRAELDDLKGQLREKGGSVVAITGTIHPPCTVYIRQQGHPVRPGKPEQRVVFFETKDPAGVTSEPFDPARLSSLGRKRMYAIAGGAPGRAADPSNLAVRVKDFDIGVADLAGEIDRYSAQSPELAASAVKIAAAAVKTDRYRKPVVFAAEAQAWVRVAEAAAGESRKKAAEKALEVCAKALELDAEHTRALGTMGRAHAVLGHYNESVASHRKAVETANRYLGEPNAALVHYDFAVTLQGIARALAGKAPDKAAQFLAEAVFQCEAYLAKEPNGPRAGECLQIVADAGPGPGTGQDATGEKPEKTAQAGG